MKRIIALVFVLVLLCSMTANAATLETPDLTKNGSITLSLEWEGNLLDSGKLMMYRVGDIVVSNSDCSFVLVDKLSTTALSLDNPQDAELAKALSSISVSFGLEPTVVPIQKGKAVFSNVAPGLYLITQNEETAITGFDPISPFLISVPNNENGVYNYDVEATPKFSLVQNDSDTKGDQGDVKLPQTGQLNWPIPMMAVSGLILFVIGVALRSGGRKRSYYEI